MMTRSCVARATSGSIRAQLGRGIYEVSAFLSAHVRSDCSVQRDKRGSSRPCSSGKDDRGTSLSYNSSCDIAREPGAVEYRRRSIDRSDSQPFSAVIIFFSCFFPASTPLIDFTLGPSLPTRLPPQRLPRPLMHDHPIFQRLSRPHALSCRESERSTQSNPLDLGTEHPICPDFARLRRRGQDAVQWPLLRARRAVYAAVREL